MSVDYEVEYNNRARVPEHAEIFARWQREAAELHYHVAIPTRFQVFAAMQT